ncbi:hypothetical protein [Nitrosomonas sp. Nm58]|nr:hypothetical protein [Nitrosomonas sp. Nm58]
MRIVADEIRMRTFLPDSISKTSSHIDIRMALGRSAPGNGG